jgi:hypothetical protein
MPHSTNARCPTARMRGFSPLRVPVIHIRKEIKLCPDAVDYIETSPIADIF